MSIPPQLVVTDPESGVSVGNDTWETNESTIFRSLVEARLGSAISRLRSTSNSMRFQQSPIHRPLQDGEDEVSPLRGSPPAKQAAWKHSSEVSPSRAAGARTDIPFRSTTAEEGGMTLAPSSPTAVSSSPVRKLRKQIESQVWSELIQSGPPYPSLKQSQAQIASYQQKIHYLTEVLHEAEVSLQDARGLGDRVATRRDQERTAAHQSIAAAEKEWRQYEATTTESMVDRGLDLAGSPLHALRARARVLLAQGDAVKQEWDDLQEKLETIPLEKREECEQALREREKLRTTYRTLVALTRRTADHQHITHQSTQHTAIPQSLKTDGSAPPPVYGACPMQCSMCGTRIRIHQDPVNDGEQGPDIRRLREFTVHHPREGTADPVEGAALVSKDGTTRVADYPNSMTFDEGRILQEYQARIHNCERRGFQAVDVAHQLTHGNVLSVAASQASSRAVQCSSASETGNISNRKNGTGTRARTPSPSPGYAMDCSTSLSTSARNSEFAHRSKWDATEFAWGVPAQANSLSVQVLEQSRKVSIHGSACHDVSSEVHAEREHLIEELAQKLDGIGQRHPSYWSGRSCARLRSWLLHHESYVTAMTCPSGSLLESTGDRHSGTHLQDARLGGLKQRGGTLRTHYMATCTTLLDNEQWFLPPHLYHRGTLRSMASVPTANNGGGNLLSRRMRGNASASIPRTSSRSPATRLHSTAYWAREFERRERLEQVRTLRRHAAKSEAKHASCT